MSLPAQLLFAARTTSELRELLENEENITQIVRSSQKFQSLHQAAEKMLLSNQNLAKANISQQPTFRDTKLLLAMKYKELEKLRSITQAKQEQLAEINSIHHANRCLLQRINHAEEEFELLFQKFEERKTPLAEFLDSVLSTRKLLHVRLVLVKKLQEIIEQEEKTTLSGAFSEYFSVGFPDQIPPVCGLTTAVVLPACCHPPFLLPLGGHMNAALCLHHTAFWSEDDKSLHVRRSHKWSARPVRLQPLKTLQRRHQQQ